MSGYAKRLHDDRGMTAAEDVRNYAQQHPQTVRLCRIDRQVVVCSAATAVQLCAIPSVAARMIGAVADDKTLEGLLNRLIDGE